jgi:ABC-type transport system involved in cytochrome c biogenesis permease component
MARAIFRKELKMLWASPLPYVLGAVFQATLGVLGWSQIVGRGQAVFQPLVPIAGFLLLLVAPILSSRAFADEIRTGTLELLLAIPVRRVALVAGKYFAVLMTLVALLVPVGVFAFLLGVYGDPDPGPIITGFVGLALLGARGHRRSRLLAHAQPAAGGHRIALRCARAVVRTHRVRSIARGWVHRRLLDLGATAFVCRRSDRSQ